MRELEMHGKHTLTFTLVAAVTLAAALGAFAGGPAESEAPALGAAAESDLSAGELHALGSAAYEAGNYEEALPLFRRAVERAAECASYRNDLGIALHRLGREAEARAALEEAIRGAPESAAAHFNLAGVLVALGEREAAVWEYREARKADPSNPGIWNDLAATLMELGWAGRAAMEYSLLVDCHPDYANGWFGYAVALERGGRASDARDAWHRFLELCQDPEGAFAQTARERLGELDTRLSARAR